MSIAPPREKCNCKSTQHSGSCNRRFYGHADTGRATASWSKAQNFLAVDGEAVGDKFFLLACSDGSSIENKGGLTTFDCLRYLTTRPAKTLWGFAFDYDVNQILGGLTITQITSLAHNKHNFIYHAEFFIKHIPGKMLQITDRNEKRTVTIWDVFSFVRSSFADWLKDWDLVEKGDLAFIKKMKDKRSSFKPRDIDDIRRYCFLELDYLETGVRELLHRVERVGLRPSGWYSPGSISAAALRTHGVEDHMPLQRDSIPLKLQNAAKAAYYGGRFETRVMGQIEGPLYHYDINSAYPHGLNQLSCLRCGSWQRVKTVDLAEPGNLVKITWKAKAPFVDKSKRPPWGPFPVRLSAGSLRYPVVNDTPAWYWSDEVNAALPLTNIKIHQAYRFTPGCNHKPFQFIPEMYQLRQQMKDEGDPAEYVLKLVLNSCYGKLAQRPRAGVIPRFYEPLWTGRITALCRAQLLGAIAQEPSAIIQTATDGLNSFARLDFPFGDDLGDWKEKELEYLFIVQSGIYWWKEKGGEMLQRSRGFHPKKMTYEICLEHWKENPGSPLKFMNKRFIGYRTALHRGDMSLWRTWPEYPVAISMTPWPKREAWLHDKGHLVTVPPIRAEALIFDEVFDMNIQALRNWELEQGDGPSGATL